ncbi:MAG: hypothetical protein KatS3mg060_3533 [Dehalococcoidia bacterium]|nr:MAG: hypothetical protein KatS3mg060_3533 [Dehalococcoidia bacterium]
MVIVGHSERRQYFGETDEIVNLKLKAALGVGLRPIVCVGERLEENEAGETAAVIERQVRGCLAGISDVHRASIAYEPVWAIGTGRAAHGEQANETIGLIRRLVADLAGPRSGRSDSHSLRRFGDPGEHRRVHKSARNRRCARRRSVTSRGRLRRDLPDDGGAPRTTRIAGSRVASEARD